MLTPSSSSAPSSAPVRLCLSSRYAATDVAATSAAIVSGSEPATEATSAADGGSEATSASGERMS